MRVLRAVRTPPAREANETRKRLGHASAPLKRCAAPLHNRLSARCTRPTASPCSSLHPREAVTPNLHNRRPRLHRVATPNRRSRLDRQDRRLRRRRVATPNRRSESAMLPIRAPQARRAERNAGPTRHKAKAPQKPKLPRGLSHATFPHWTACAHSPFWPLSPTTWVCHGQPAAFWA